MAIPTKNQYNVYDAFDPFTYDGLNKPIPWWYVPAGVFRVTYPPIIQEIDKLIQTIKTTKRNLQLPYNPCNNENTWMILLGNIQIQAIMYLQYMPPEICIINNCVVQSVLGVRVLPVNVLDYMEIVSCL